MKKLLSILLTAGMLLSVQTAATASVEGGVYEATDIINITGKAEPESKVVAMLYNGTATAENLKFIDQADAEEDGTYRFKIYADDASADWKVKVNVNGEAADSTLTAVTAENVIKATPYIRTGADGVTKAYVDFENYFNVLNKTYTVLASFYDESGRLVNCQMSDTKALGIDASNPEYKVTLPAEYKSMKLMLWDSAANLTPYTKAIEKTKVEAYAPTSETQQKIVINCIGDSITDNGSRWNLQPEPETDSAVRYCTELSKYFQCDVYNNGAAGTRVSSYIGVDNADTNDKLGGEDTVNSFAARVQSKDIKKADADIVTVLGGVNDCNRTGKAFLGTPADTTDSTFCGGYRIMVEELIEKFPEARIVCFTPLKEGGAETYRATAEDLILYVDAIKEICKDYPQVDVIDLYNAPEVDFTNSISTTSAEPHDGDLMKDGLHPTKSGHVKLGKYIVDQFIAQGIININD